MKVLFRFLTLLFLIISTHFSNASAQMTVSRIYPPNWWVNMQNDTLHLMIYGNNLKNIEVGIDKKKIKILNQRENAHGNYLFLDLLIDKNIDPGNFTISFENKNEKTSIQYELKPRINSKHKMMGLDQTDFIYLIMPDRFANGNKSNDVIKGTNQESINRDSAFYRHGGDLQGIINHVDYLSELGVSALWLNPAEENDQPLESYHGYAITDHYTVDTRLGDNNLYKSLVTKLHENNIKIIRDVVFNHFGSEHPLIKNLPESSWINNWENYTRSNFRATTLLDPYASEYDKMQFSNGWFDHHMPDMNYSNIDLQNYMIQNSIWWIEEFDVDAYRIDTYAYSDQSFMKKWAEAIKKEYPDFFMFAETWVHSSSIQAWFAGGNKMNQGETSIDGVTDFQLYYALNKALNEPYGWTEGVSNMYYDLIDDILYVHPEKNVLFLDNHDLDRFYGVINQDFTKFTMGISLLLTMRGIPSLFYGTEILMPYTGSHGIIRTDFPGGWPDDTINKFEATGRTDLENEAFDYIKKLANWRKNSEAITKGKLMQFVPENGVWVYFRYTEEEIVMVVVNQNNNSVKLDLNRFDEVLKGKSEFVDITVDNELKSVSSLTLKPMHVHIFEVN